ncbi:TPA: hypothetical protein RQN97_001669 [Klebsiella michiganensis]|nr:hypothetical protein [Klebsiella michiganensis]
MSIVNIYTTDNILGRSIQYYFCSIVDNILTSDSEDLIELGPEPDSEIILINLISSPLSPLKIINFINTKYSKEPDPTIVVFVDSRDILICRNIITNKKTIVMGFNSSLSRYEEILNGMHPPLFEDIKKDNKLTGKELDILGLLLDGHRINEISTSLQSSSKTIYNHRKNTIKKLNFKNTMELTQSIVRLNAYSTNGIQS